MAFKFGLASWNYGIRVCLETAGWGVSYEPGSEFRLHRHWIVSSAMDEPLNTDFIVAKKDRLYRCLDRVLEPKRDLFLFLRQKWADLFVADFEVLLYDLTSTYFEDEMKTESESQARLQP